MVAINYLLADMILFLLTPLQVITDHITLFLDSIKTRQAISLSLLWKMQEIIHGRKYAVIHCTIELRLLRKCRNKDATLTIGVMILYQ
jgi:hypothetical protein